MERFRGELKNVKHFNSEYYSALLETIDRYIEEKPDISIETCKSVIEGLSKLILMELGQEPESYFKNKDLSLSRIFKDARNCLKDNIERHIDDIVYDDAIIDTYGVLPSLFEQLLNPELIARIGSLRNDYGDISHGRSPLKVQVNDEDLAELIVSLTDCISSYMLKKFTQVKRDVVIYEDNTDFNEYLDQQYPLDGQMIYSEILYEKFYEDYEIKLGDYKYEKDLEEQEEIQ